MNNITLSKMQRELIEKIINHNPDISRAALIDVLGTMDAKARLKYLKDTYMDLLENNNSAKLQKDIENAYSHMHLDIIDPNAITKPKSPEEPKQEKQQVPRKKKDDFEGYETFNFTKRQLTPSELLGFEETILDFFMEHPECNVSNVDMSIYHDIDERSYSILLNQAKFIHKIINSATRVSERKCAFCNEPIIKGASGIIIYADSYKKIEDSNFNVYHQQCYVDFLQTIKQQGINLKKDKKKMKSFMPVPENYDNLEIALVNMGIVIISTEQNKSVYQILVRGKDQDKFHVIIFDSKTSKLYLNEEPISDLFEVKKTCDLV